MIPQDDGMAAIDVWMRYTLSTIEKEFGSHSNESHVQRLIYIPGIRRSSERLHSRAHQDREFVRHKRLYTGPKNEVDCSTQASVKGEIN
jgi:hypothetical protein